jgi:hypothetical protein
MAGSVADVRHVPPLRLERSALARPRGAGCGPGVGFVGIVGRERSDPR